MPLPLLAIGAGMAAAGLIGGAASGAMGTGRHVAAPQVDPTKYQWGGSPDALNQENARLLGTEDGGRALALSARDQQSALAARYQQMANGQGPSLAQKQMEQGLADAQRQQMAQAAATRGGAGNALLAQRAAQRTGAEMALATNRDAGMARTAEQLGAMNAQAGLYGQMRGADQQAYQADMQARYGLQGQQLEANMAQERNRMGAEQWAAQQNAQIDEAGRARKAQMWGGLTSAGGSMLSMGVGGMGGGGGAPAPEAGVTDDEWRNAYVGAGGKGQYA